MPTQKNSKSRREFLLLSATSPILLIPTKSEAFFPALIIRFIAGKLIRIFIKKGAKRFIKNLVVENVKKRGRARVSIKNVVQIHKNIKHLVNTHKYLSNQVWNRNKENHSTLVISNPSHRTVKTKKITLKMKDRNDKRTEFKAKVNSISIPPKSTVVVDLGVKKIRRTGLKRLHASVKKHKTSSGNILVSNHTNGLTVEELYRRYYQKKGGVSNGLSPNIIL